MTKDERERRWSEIRETLNQDWGRVTEGYYDTDPQASFQWFLSALADIKVDVEVMQQSLEGGK